MGPPSHRRQFQLCHSLAVLATALALTGHEVEARDPKQRRAAVSPSKSIAAGKERLAPLHLPIPAFGQRLTGLSMDFAKPECRRGDH